MIYAGEDPRFIMRRLLFLASKDVSLAAPLRRCRGSPIAGLLEYAGGCVSVSGVCALFGHHTQEQHILPRLRSGRS